LVLSNPDELAAAGDDPPGPSRSGRGGLTRAFAFAAVLASVCAGAFAAAPSSEEEALSHQGVAGEIMDIAVEQCRQGNREQAMAMFEAIRAQLEPPPAIDRLIRELQATGCATVPLAQSGGLRLQVGGGWDSNVSQGITARTLVLGSGGNAIELELSPNYLPRSSTFTQTSVDYSVALPRYGATVQLALGQRLNLQAHDFDLRTFSAATAREWSLPLGSVRGQLEATEVWLGNRDYQRSGSATVQWLYAMPTGAWLATGTATAVRYVTQPSQNATVFELGLLREWRIDARKSVHASLTAQVDNAHGARPGGDRLGFQAQVGGVVLAEGWRIRPQVGYSSWDSEDVFAPALLDVKRRNRLWQGWVQAERPLNMSTSLLLEWRGRWARDTIALYRYQARVLSATLSFRF
jgi:hypothetical protein